MYTSRPALKGLIRLLSTVSELVLQVSSQGTDLCSLVVVNRYAASALGLPGTQASLLPAIGYARATNGVMCVWHFITCNFWTVLTPHTRQDAP